MPSEVLCAWCGKAIVAAVADPIPGIAAAVCQPCADWHRARGLDQEDRLELEGLGAIRPAPGPRDNPRT
jgi:hypothetical protein